MKVAVIGATGRAGRLIADELVARGIETYGLVIDPENVKNEKVHVVEKNIFDLCKDDLKDYDVVINAFGQFTPGKCIQHQTAMMTLINALKDLPDVRFLVIGGAGSMFLDDTRTKRLIDVIPPEVNELPMSSYLSFLMLEPTNIKWTFVSPACNFDANGVRTGKYVLGTDVIIKNDEGESYISYADFAKAMVDEVMIGNFIGKRMTAVSNKNDPEVKLA